jgi:hypothetical protein
LFRQEHTVSGYSSRFSFRLPNAGLCDREMNTSLDTVVHGAQNPSMSDMRADSGQDSASQGNAAMCGEMTQLRSLALRIGREGVSYNNPPSEGAGPIAI